jgi:signal transduction histidine kinase
MEPQQWAMSETKHALADSDYIELLSLAVHELRTPASVVGGYLRMLLRESDSPLSERQLKMVSDAERSCQRLVAVISELSEIQKIDANVVTLDKQTFDLFPMIEEMAKGVHELSDRDGQLVCRGQPRGASTRGDLTRLQQAFSAILRAIVREMPIHGRVIADRRIETQHSISSAIVIVAEEHSVQSAYEAPRGPFNEKRGGLGLALPIARRVIERHGGSVWSPAGDTGRQSIIVSLPLLG